MAPPERMPRELATVAESAAAGPIRLLEYLPDLAADLDTGQAATASREADGSGDRTRPRMLRDHNG